MSLLTLPVPELLDRLFNGDRPRMEVVGVCLLRFQETAPEFRRLLEKAADGTLDPSEEDRFFVGLHILIGGCDPLSFKPFVRLMRQPDEGAHEMLGDALTETVTHAFIGMFDGDEDALFSLAQDEDVNEYIRAGAIDALAFLAWEGRIKLDRVIRLLERLDDEAMGYDGEYVWCAWEQAISLLGLDRLAGRVERAFESGRLDESLGDLDEFRELLDRSKAEPADAERFYERDVGYLEDVIEQLELYQWETLEADDDLDRFAGWSDDDRGPRNVLDVRSWTPIINPWRDVGRNDPCPCGSGKKFKKCCLDKAG